MPAPWDRIFSLASRIFVWGLLFSILYLLRPFFLLVFLTFVFAYILEHGVEGLKHRIGSRPLRVVLVSSVFLATLITAGVFLSPHFKDQATKLSRDYPQYLSKIDEALDDARESSWVRTLIPPKVKARDIVNDIVGLVQPKKDGEEDAATGDKTGTESTEADPTPEPVYEIDDHLEAYPGGLAALVIDAKITWPEFLDFLRGRGSEAPIETIAKLAEPIAENKLSTLDGTAIDGAWLSAQWREAKQKPLPEERIDIRETIDKLKNITAPVLGVGSAFLLSLLFSFLIVLDLPKLSRAVGGLSGTKIGFIYDEVGPNIRDFGKMLGRALEAQMLIALCNTGLTAIGLYILDLAENLVFFSTVVFFCSFIPVAGVFLSSTPIALEALSQGGVQLMMFSIVMILIIHFIEAYFLNPRIFGHHLHMNAVLVLIVLTICGKLFGVWGLVLGLPVVNYFFGHAIRRRDGEVAPAPDAS